MTEQNLRKIVALTAMEELGYTGKNGVGALVPTKYNKYAEYLDTVDGFYNFKKNGYDWCAIFVDYIMVDCLGRAIAEICTCHTNCGAGCQEAYERYLKNGYIVGRPEVGDEVFYFSRTKGKVTHTGIVVSVDNEKFGSVEGNCSNQVKLYYRKWDDTDNYIPFFASPNYELAADMLTEKEDTPTEREMNEHEKWAIENGLLIGDGEGNYFLDSAISRGHLCSVLYRLVEMLRDS